jgi:hypothetical protein
MNDYTLLVNIAANPEGQSGCDFGVCAVPHFGKFGNSKAGCGLKRRHRMSNREAPIRSLKSNNSREYLSGTLLNWRALEGEADKGKDI